jgi:Tfp pilus assembly protein PilF
MSLLLEALKKAEKAKEEAQRGAKDGSATESQRTAEAPPGEGAKRVVTRDELPDISAPLEILSEDLTASAPRAPSAMALSPSEPPAAATAPAEESRPMGRREAARSATAPDQPSAERAMAKNVLEAKFKESDPRIPFFITVGVLGVLAVSVAGYFWVQLRPPPPLANANPPRSATEKPVGVAGAPPPAGAQTAQGQVQSQIPGLPVAPVVAAPDPGPAAATPPVATSAPVTKPAPSGDAKPAPRPARGPAGDSAARAAPRAAGAASDRGGAQEAVPAERALTFSRSVPQIHPRVAAGYTAYQAGDLAAARNEYQQALTAEPTNRDALLGLAAVEIRAQRYDVAEAHYQRLLRADPRDPHANAGMLALRGQQLDPVLSESRVKTLLAANPEASVLYFTLGNQLAQQGRWPEAQQAYFKAHTADPENPDFAFNLAVSLDQLRQPGLALEHYRRALALAEKRVANFSLETARVRIQQLSR